MKINTEWFINYSNIPEINNLKNRVENLKFSGSSQDYLRELEEELNQLGTTYYNLWVKYVNNDKKIKSYNGKNPTEETKLLKSFLKDNESYGHTDEVWKSIVNTLNTLDNSDTDTLKNDEFDSEMFAKELETEILNHQKTQEQLPTYYTPISIPNNDLTEKYPKISNIVEPEPIPGTIFKEVKKPPRESKIKKNFETKQFHKSKNVDRNDKSKNVDRNDKSKNVDRNDKSKNGNPKDTRKNGNPKDKSKDNKSKNGNEELEFIKNLKVKLIEIPFEEIEEEIKVPVLSGRKQIILNDKEKISFLRIKGAENMERELLLMYDEFLLTYKKTGPKINLINPQMIQNNTEKEDFFKIHLNTNVVLYILYYRYTFIDVFYKFFDVKSNWRLQETDQLYWEQAVRTHLFECNKLKKALKSPLSFWFFIEEPSWFFDLQEISVAQDGRLIDSMPKIYEKLNLISVNNPFALQYIKNPSQRVIIKAIKKNGQVIKFLKQATDEMFKIILEQNGTFIRFIDNPTEKQKILAIKNDIHAIKFIQNQQLQFQLLFIKLLEIKLLFTCFLNKLNSN